MSTVEVAAALHATSTRIDPQLLDWMTKVGLKNFEGLNLDADALRVCGQELLDAGPPSPVVRVFDPVFMRSRPFAVRWADFALTHCDREFHLEFADPLTEKRCRFHLFSRSELAPLRASWKGLSSVSEPRLMLSGLAAKESVTGEAWLERRLGKTAWLAPDSEKGRMIAIDYFGFRLEDGSDWMIFRQRDAASGEQLAALTTVRDRSGSLHSSPRLLAKPLRTWLSDASSACYPVAWRLGIPEFEAEFTFEPAAEEQEINLVGPARGLWHGTGNVQGMVRGRGVSGFGAAELHGYGVLFSFQALLDAKAASVDGAIEDFLPRTMDEKTLEGYLGPAQWMHEPAAYSATLCEPVWDLIARKGKRWRPAFGTFLLEALGTPSAPYRDLMSVFPELGHTGSLIIDDIEDDSLIRRGQECLHRRYGLDVALNAGNLLYFLPTLLLARHPRLNDKQRLEIHEIINRLFIQAHFGQGLDIYWSRHISPQCLDEWKDDKLGAKILQMYAYKTAAFVASFAEIAAVIAGAAEEVRKACIRFSWTFGVAFQILDDVRNFTSSPHWTKVSGEDLAAGKLTYVVCRALARLAAQEGERLVTILCTKALRETPATHAEGCQLVRQSGALESCTEEARTMTEEAWALLAKHLSPSGPRMMLRLLCQKMLDLPYDP